MKKKYLLILLFICSFVFLIFPKNTHAAIYLDSYEREGLMHYPYSPEYGTTTESRLKYYKNHIYLQVEYGTWRTIGYDHFWLKNNNSGQLIRTWSESRAASKTTGEPFNVNGKTVYRRDSGWIDIGGAVPNKPTGYFYNSGTKYLYNFSGTSNGLATFSYDYSWTNGSKYEYVPSAGISASANDYITGFYYIIDQNPTTIVNASNGTHNTTGSIDVSSYILANKAYYIHIVSKSYTGLYSQQLNAVIQDNSLKRNVTLTKDSGIREITGTGSYYPGQKVTITATVMDSGFKWSKWLGTQNITSQTYSFVMANENVAYQATTTPYQYEITFNGNGATKGEMQPIKATYDDIVKLPPNSFLRDNVVCKYMGWNLNVEDNLLINDQASVKVSELVDALKIGNTGGQIPLFAIWDDAPVIKAEDRYISRVQADSGFITESEIINNIHVTDKEDGVIPKEQIKLLYFNTEDFKQAIGIYGISVNIHAFDTVGNESEFMIMVNIVDPEVKEEVEPNARFISLKYLDKPESEGGLYEDSIWRTGERYALLKKTLENELIDQEVAELKLFGFTLKKKRPGSGHYKTPPEETRYYDEEDIARLKKQYSDDF